MRTTHRSQETALKITRIGKDISTCYQVIGYDEMPIDLSNLIGYIDGMSYLSDELEDLIEEIDGLDEKEAAAAIGKRLLAKREAEVLDPERYDELLEGVDEPAKFAKKKKGAKEDPKKTRRGGSRKAKASSSDDEPADEPQEPASDPEPTEEVSEKPKARRKGKAEKQTPADRMAELKQRAAKAAAARK